MYRELFLVFNLFCCILLPLSAASNSRELTFLELERRVAALERITNRSVRALAYPGTINSINYSLVCIASKCAACPSSNRNARITSENAPNEKSYHVNLDLQMDYLSALQWCSARNMKLATINSVEENEQFISQTHLPYGVNYWIGLAQTQGHNHVWFHNGKAPKFTNWDEGVVDNTPLQRCAVANSTTGKWLDSDCSSTSHFVCEVDPAVLSI